MSKSIFLLGDVVRHVYLKPVEDKNAHFEKKGEYKVYTQAMKSSDNRMECPPIIKQIIVKAINDPNLIIKPDYKFTYASDKPELSLFRILKKFPKTSEKTDGKKVWRADPSSEYFGSELILIPPSGSDKSEKFAIMQELFNKINDDDQPNLLVLCDRNSELRDFIKTKTGAQTKLKTLLGNTQQAIVIGIKECVKDDTWLSILAKLTEGHQEKCIVILSVDDLRNAGLSINEHGTIEQNIREIVGYLDEEPLNKIWRKICQHLVFIFRENLVLCLNADSSNDIYPGNGTYHYCPYFDRPAQIRPGLYGKMPGKFTIMVASIVKHLCESVCGLEKSINIAVRLGILAYDQYFKYGYCNIDNRSPSDHTPFDVINTALAKDKLEKLYENSWDTENKENKCFYMSSLAINIGRIKDDLIKIKNKRYDKPYDSSTGLSSDIWSRSEALFEYYTTKKIIDLGLESELIKCSGTEKEEKFVLHRIVKYGLEAVIYKAKYIHGKIINDSDVNLFSDYKIICPPLELEGIKIIDEEHMNGFVDLAQLLRTYLSSHNQSDQPLCIGIFGPPGEGKSFTIKQIIKHVCPERKSDELTLTFNLAQFDSIEQLTEAFHQIQDKVLKHPGEPPLIIFDEFDAKYGTQELGWLKFFLAPMQDDMFHGKSVEYKVGKAIFVFSGGTCKTFQEFNEKFSAKVDEDKRKAVKLTDFIGRLKGFMDVKGINSTGDVISRIVKLRRAIILRSLLKKNAKPIFATDEKTARIHDKVIEAFIETKNYKFGIRSMEAIIQMSRWIDKEFIPASLPSLEQLEMHIDIQAFKKIKSGGELT